MSGARNTAARNEESSAWDDLDRDARLGIHVGASHAGLSAFCDRVEQLSDTGRRMLAMTLAGLDRTHSVLRPEDEDDLATRELDVASCELDEDTVVALVAMRAAGRLSDDPAVVVIAAMVDEALAGEVAAGRVPA